MDVKVGDKVRILYMRGEPQYTYKEGYVQLIDDEAGRTLASASTVEKEMRAQKLAANMKSAAIIGKTIAERTLALNIKEVVFDRGGFPFHGCVKAVADAAREAGLVF